MTEATPGVVGPASTTGGTVENPAAPAADAPWFSTLPADLHSEGSITKYQSSEELARGHVALSKMLGDKTNHIPLPAAGDTAAFRSTMEALGLPKAVDSYTLTDVKDMPPELGANNDMAEAFRQASFELGILPQQAQGLFEKMVGFIANGQQEATAGQSQQADADIAALQQKHGDAFKRVVDAAGLVADHYGLTKVLNDAGLGTNATIVEFLASMSDQIGEDRSPSRGNGSPFAGNPADLIEQANALTRQMISTPNRAEKLALAQKAADLRARAALGK